MDRLNELRRAVFRCSCKLRVVQFSFRFATTSHSLLIWYVFRFQSRESTIYSSKLYFFYLYFQDWKSDTNISKPIWESRERFAWMSFIAVSSTFERFLLKRLNVQIPTPNHLKLHKVKHREHAMHDNFTKSIRINGE